MTKIDIISGFLGAGKTTFIKKLLEEAIAGEQVVLIENEFGEIGIDGGFLKDAGIEIREMNSGCICCSLVGDFGKSLAEVLNKYQPERVIIEPSGVGKLSDVMNAVRDVAQNLDVKLNSAVTIVDAAKCKMYMKNFGEFFNNQVENAGTIVLSRTDVADAKKVQQDVELLREHNTTASIMTTPISKMSGAELLKLIEKPDTMMEDLLAQVKEDHGHHYHEHGESCGFHNHEYDADCACGGHEYDADCACGGHGHDHDADCACGGHDHDADCACGGHGHDHDADCACGGHDHGAHHADEVFSSWGMETISSCTKEDLTGILDELAYGNHYGDVLRAKGMLASGNPGEWYYFDLVPEEYEIRIGNPDYTGKVCVIGANLNEAELINAFDRSYTRQHNYCQV